MSKHDVVVVHRMYPKVSRTLPVSKDSNYGEKTV
jgi:hypothetical protein